MAKKMHKDRLLLLAKKLRELAKKPPKKFKFDLRYWGLQREERAGKKPTKLTCATSACAVGSAMLMPEFQKLGLKADLDPNSDTISGKVLMVPVYKWYRAFKAVEQFFGITDDQALYLFEPGYYKVKHRTDPALVAARIEYFVVTKGVYLTGSRDTSLENHYNDDD